MSSGFLDSGLQALHSLSISTGVSEGQLLAGLVLFLGGRGGFRNHQINDPHRSCPALDLPRLHPGHSPVEPPLITALTGRSPVQQ